MTSVDLGMFQNVESPTFILVKETILNHVKEFSNSINFKSRILIFILYFYPLLQSALHKQHLPKISTLK